MLYCIFSFLSWILCLSPSLCRKNWILIVRFSVIPVSLQMPLDISLVVYRGPSCSLTNHTPFVFALLFSIDKFFVVYHISCHKQSSKIALSLCRSKRALGKDFWEWGLILKLSFSHGFLNPYFFCPFILGLALVLDPDNLVSIQLSVRDEFC